MSSHCQSVRWVVSFLFGLFSLSAESATGLWIPGGPEGGSVWALTFDPGGSGRVFAQVAKVGAASTVTTSYRLKPDTGSWEALAGQSVDSLAIASGKPTALYALQGGLLKSLDSGRSWQSVSDTGPTSGRIYTAPSDPSTLYVIASGEDNPETGLAVFYQSRDEGKTWQKGQWPARFISLQAPALFPGGGALAIDLNNPEILYAAGSGTAAGHFIFHSYNGGQSWEQRTSFTELNSNPRTIIIDPHDPQTLYIAADPNTNQGEDCNDSGGLFKSSDAGFSWIRLPLDECRVRSVVVDSQHPGVIYVGTESGIYKATDGGTHWQHVSDTINTLRLAIDPTNPQTLIAGTLMEGMLKTDDGGQHWYWFNKRLHELSIFDVAIAPSQHQVLYASTAVGIFKSSDGGISWPREPLSLYGRSISALVIDPRDADIVYATDNQNVYKTVDGGWHWLNILEGTGSSFSLSPLRLAPNNADIVYAGADFKSLNQGRNWVIDMNVLGHDIGPVITAMTIMPDSSVFAGIANGFMTRDSIGPAHHPSCLAAKGEGGILQQPFGLASQRVFYASGVFRKQEDSLGWCRVNLPIDHSTQIKTLEYRASSNLDSQGVLWTETTQGVYQSQDRGDSWIKTAHLIIPQVITDDESNIVYGVINDKPVWSQDKGDSWETFNLNLKPSYPENTDPQNRNSRNLTYLSDRKIFLSTGIDGLFIYNKPESFIPSFKFMAESPVTDTRLSAISTVHGWAFSTQLNVSIEQISFDQSIPLVLDKFDIPCCGQRDDVAAAFPQYPAASNSGWGMAINWSDLAEGAKNIRFKVYNSVGESYISAPKNVTLAPIAGASFLDQFNPNRASAEIKDNRLLLKNVSVRDKVTGTVSLINAQFHWSGAHQSFQIFAEPTAVAEQAERVSKQAESTAQAVVAASNGIYSFIDAPAVNAIVSGIGVIYGWAFPDNPTAAIESIQINIDGEAYGDIPCCSIRSDVVQSYESVQLYYPAVGLSGWGMVFNFSTLDTGKHTLQLTITSNDGSSVTHQRQVSVVKPGDFDFLSDLDLSEATVSISNHEIILRGVGVKDKSTQQSKRVKLKLQWVAGLQSLTLVSSETL